jgi:hypothetical protein
MAARLKNTLSFANLAPGATVVLIHGLKTGGVRPLAPDIVFIPSPDLNVVSANTLNVTIRNTGPVSFSGSILVEAWHTIERAFSDVNDEDLLVKPYVVVSVEGNGQPVQPPFSTPPTVITIYARTTGSDTTGVGTLANPYLTMQRAVRDIPSDIAAGVSYIVDITDITETLPLDYELPSWKAPETSRSQYAGPIVPDPFFAFGTAVAISATPRMTSLLSVADATILSTDNTQATASANNGHGLITLTLTGAPRPAWAANAIKGKVLCSLNGALQNFMIAESTSTTLLITSTTPLTGTLTIREPSAHLIVSSTADATTARGGINAINCDSISFNGLKITSTTPATPNTYGLAITGAGFAAVQFCELQNAAFLCTSIGKTRPNRVWFYGTLRIAAEASIQACFLDTITTLQLQAAEGTYHFRQCIFSACAPIRAAVTAFPGITAGTQFGPCDLFQLDNVLVQNTPGVTGDGVVVYGVRARLNNVGINGCGRDGVRCEIGPGSLQLDNVRTLVANGVSAAGFGLNIIEGQWNVKPNATTSGATATASQLRGGAGDMKVGTLVARTWTNYVSGADGRPPLQEVDIGGSLATGITGTTSSVRN